MRFFAARTCEFHASPRLTYSSTEPGAFGSMTCGAVPSTIPTFKVGKMTPSMESGSDEQ